MAIESVMHVRVDVGLFPSASRFRIFWMFDLCYLYHDFASTVFLCRRVFDFTVSDVSNVSILYFSRD